MKVSLKAQNHPILNKARLRVTLLSDSAVILKQARKFDRVVLAIIALTFVLVILNFDQAKASLNFTLDALVGISGFLLLSVSAAAFAKATGLDQQIARVFSGNPIKAILAAAIFGAISPFCSCGVVSMLFRESIQFFYNRKIFVCYIYPVGERRHICKPRSFWHFIRLILSG